jgi:hypothetical protein
MVSFVPADLFRRSIRRRLTCPGAAESEDGIAGYAIRMSGGVGGGGREVTPYPDKFFFRSFFVPAYI